MHELSLALAVVEQVSELAVKENASIVEVVTLSIGRLAGVERDALSFCFPLAAKDTILENTRLVIEEEPAIITCEDCGASAELTVLCMQCQNCKSCNVLLVGGRELRIKSIEVN